MGFKIHLRYYSETRDRRGEGLECIVMRSMCAEKAGMEGLCAARSGGWRTLVVDLSDRLRAEERVLKETIMPSRNHHQRLRTQFQVQSSDFSSSLFASFLLHLYLHTALWVFFDSLLQPSAIVFSNCLYKSIFFKESQCISPLLLSLS